MRTLIGVLLSATSLLAGAPASATPPITDVGSSSL